MSRYWVVGDELRDTVTGRGCVLTRVCAGHLCRVQFDDQTEDTRHVQLLAMERPGASVRLEIRRLQRGASGTDWNDVRYIDAHTGQTWLREAYGNDPHGIAERVCRYKEWRVVTDDHCLWVAP